MINDDAKVKNTDIGKTLTELRSYCEVHLKLAEFMLNAYDSTIYPLDILAVAALNRSLNLIFGFCTLVEARNFISAAPLLRLQIDTCLRFYASFIVDNPHDFALAVLKGTPINKQKDKGGNRMTDSYLVKMLSKEEPWVIKVYKQSSGYIHLSDKHIFNSMSSSPNGERSMELRIGQEDAFVSDDLYLEAIAAFKAATELFLRYIHGWAFTKDNPKIVERLKKNSADLKKD